MPDQAITSFDTPEEATPQEVARVDPSIALFDFLDDALAWRAGRGGWVFTSEAGPAIWFCLRFTPTAIITHPAVSAFGSGKLV